MQRFLPHWRRAIDSLQGRRVRFALDVDPLGFAWAGGGRARCVDARGGGWERQAI